MQITFTGQTDRSLFYEMLKLACKCCQRKMLGWLLLNVSRFQNEMRDKIKGLFPKKN
jgi:hypothetical protein